MKSVDNLISKPDKSINGADMGAKLPVQAAYAQRKGSAVGACGDPAAFQGDLVEK